MSTLDCTVVIPTTGRDNLAGLLEMLAKSWEPGLHGVVSLVDAP